MVGSRKGQLCCIRSRIKQQTCRREISGGTKGALDLPATKPSGTAKIAPWPPKVVV